MERRTRVEPLTLAAIDALITGDDAYAAETGRPVAPGYLDWPEALVLARDALRAGTPPEWSSHLVLAAVDGIDTVVGFGGFKGAPQDGTVEIGYSVAPAHRRRGHASAAVAAWIDAARVAGVARVQAVTIAEPSASTRLLGRAGFVRVAAYEDDELGPVWRWELSLGPEVDREGEGEPASGTR